MLFFHTSAMQGPCGNEPGFISTSFGCLFFSSGQKKFCGALLDCQSRNARMFSTILTPVQYENLIASKKMLFFIVVQIKFIELKVALGTLVRISSFGSMLGEILTLEV